jgi:hypothetical protein
MFVFGWPDDHRRFVDNQLDHEFHDDRDHDHCGPDHQLHDNGRTR